MVTINGKVSRDLLETGADVSCIAKTGLQFGPLHPLPPHFKVWDKPPILLKTQPFCIGRNTKKNFPTLCETLLTLHTLGKRLIQSNVSFSADSFRSCQAADAKDGL